ncbi:MAG: hypothetical protein AAFR96_05490 [Planctomycetota bacterium]
MSDGPNQPDALADKPTPAPPSDSQIRELLESLPEVRTPHDHAECLARAERLSKRGKLPGFAKSPAADPKARKGLFTCSAFGAPFDFRLVVDHWQIEGTRTLSFRAEPLKKLPAVYAAVLAFTVWPGVVFTDSLLNTWFGWYPNAWWFTWAWYIPLTLLPLPWVWRSITRKSRAAALVHAYEQIERLTAAVDGEYVDRDAEPGQAKPGDTEPDSSE